MLWDLRFITKLQKKGGNKYYFYTKKPRARILKKKFLIKKLVNYYYNFSFSKKIRSLLVFTKKLKNKVTTEYGLNLMNTFESHLSVFVLRCKYVSNMLDSKSLITSGGVLVNGVIVYNPGYVLNTCDIVQLNKFQVPLFIRRFLRINKPQRWKKNRYFYRLTTRNELSEIIYNKRLYRRMVKLRKRGIIMYHKFYWKKRKFSPTFFKKRFYLNFLPIQQY